MPVVAATIAVAPLAACFDLDFHSDGTSIVVTASPDTETDVAICAGPSDLLDCNEDNETFSVTLGSATEPATEFLLSFGMLDALFDGANGGLTVSASRDSDGATGTVQIPPALDLQGPTGHVSRGGRVALVWFATHEGKLTWSSSVTCDGSDVPVTGDDRELADTGHAEIAARELPGPSGACTAFLSLSRTYTGKMSAAYGSDSTITAEQSESVEFDLLD